MLKNIAQCLLLPVLLAGAGVHADEATLTAQRDQYRKAQKALQAGKTDSFRKLSASLTDYPLYPYLLLEYIRPRLSSVSESHIAEALDTHDDVPLAADIRRSWLLQLARRGKWSSFLEHYRPQTDKVLQCHRLRAGMETGNLANLPEEIRQVWLNGESLPSECDPAFEVLYQSPLMNDDLVWQRIGLAMQEGQTRLAGYLGKQLSTANRALLDRWLQIYNQPGKGLARVDLDDTPLTREILTQGMIRLARTDLDAAIRVWNELDQRYDFATGQRASVSATLAMRAVLADHESAATLLDAPDLVAGDESVFHWRLRYALEHLDWTSLARWTEGPVPEDEAVRLRWQYWRARALELTGRSDTARDLYARLATERDYYGFLAADRMQQPYNLRHIDLPRDPEISETVAAIPAIRRAHEFFLLGQRYPARREWQNALRDLDTEKLEAAAGLASDWGWHDRAILTLGSARSFDDLKVRFPVVYEKQLRKFADERQLDLGWVYALTRAESAFMEDARSPAGALGLMQVMPATGQQTARSLQLKGFDKNHLLEAERNITIGTAYLRQVYQRFGNLVMATAAYNAGPNAVARWQPETACQEPDIWVERIPYTETRKYVSRIMFYATVYDWRLAQDIIPMNHRMTMNGTPETTQVAGLSCTPDNLVSLR